MFKIFRCPCGVSFGIANLIQDSINRLIKTYNSNHIPVILREANGVAFSVSTTDPDEFVKFTKQYFRKKGLTVRVASQKRIGEEMLIEFEVNL